MLPKPLLENMEYSSTMLCVIHFLAGTPTAQQQKSSPDEDLIQIKNTDVKGRGRVWVQYLMPLCTLLTHSMSARVQLAPPLVDFQSSYLLTHTTRCSRKQLKSLGPGHPPQRPPRAVLGSRFSLSQHWLLRAFGKTLNEWKMPQCVCLCLPHHPERERMIPLNERI